VTARVLRFYGTAVVAFPAPMVRLDSAELDFYYSFRSYMNFDFFTTSFSCSTKRAADNDAMVLEFM
jgi:hypothetical protein